MPVDTPLMKSVRVRPLRLKLAGARFRHLPRKRGRKEVVYNLSGLRSAFSKATADKLRATQLTPARFRQYPHFVLAGLDPTIQNFCVAAASEFHAHLGGPHSRAMTFIA